MINDDFRATDKILSCVNEQEKCIWREYLSVEFIVDEDTYLPKKESEIVQR